MVMGSEKSVEPREAGTDFHEYLLAEIRCAALRARILQSDREAVGIALMGGLVTPDQALELLHDVDALRVVGTPPAEAR
jgi:hypothetical protein